MFGRIRATNVIVLGVEYAPSPADRRSPEAQTVGTGPAYFFSGGEVIEGTWKREFTLFPIEYLGPDGEPIQFAPGNTWIELADVERRQRWSGRGVAIGTTRTVSSPQRNAGNESTMTR